MTAREKEIEEISKLPYGQVMIDFYNSFKEDFSKVKEISNMEYSSKAGYATAAKRLDGVSFLWFCDQITGLPIEKKRTLRLKAAIAMRDEKKRRRHEVIAVTPELKVKKLTTEQFDAMKFPPALKKNTPLGHDGRLNEDQIQRLTALGYEVQHYQQVFGPRQVEIYLQGCILGTIEYDDKKFKSIESMRKHYMRISKESAEGELQKRLKKDPIKMLTRWGKDIGTGRYIAPQRTADEIKEKRAKEAAEMETSIPRAAAEVLNSTPPPIELDVAQKTGIAASDFGLRPAAEVRAKIQ